MRLAQNIPQNVNHIAYFDNFFSNIPLSIYLRSCGIFSLGTIRENRIPNSQLSKNEQSKKQPRGYTEEFVGTAHGCTISTVLWNDTKPVRLISTYAGVEPFVDEIDGRCKPQVLRRWDKLTKEYVTVKCPTIISEYNQHMGGVDLMDGLIGRYHIKMKTRKWTHRLFHHLIDVTLTNAYILYNRVRVDEKMELADFRSSVAEALCFFAGGAKRRVGRPAATSQPLPKKNTTKLYLPVDDVRFDGFNHMITFLDRSGKKMCKNPSCKSETQAFCTKCKLNLCCSTTKDCFRLFHTPTDE